MEQKTKFIIIGLIGVSLICSFLYIQTLVSKQDILRERDDLKKELSTVNSKADELEKRRRDAETRAGALDRQLESISREKEEIERRFELANRSKDELARKLKEMQDKPRETTYVAPQAQQQLQELPQATDAYWAGILKAKTDLELQLGSIRSELKSIQISNEQLQREKGTLELDINNLTREREDLRRQLDYNQKILDSLAQELVRERNDKIQIQDSLKLIKNENVVLTRQLKSINNRKVNLERKIQQVQEGNASTERKLTEMETMLTDKISQVNDLKERLDAILSGAKSELPPEKKEPVELPPIVVRPHAEAPERTQGDSVANFALGRVLAVNRENRFVIVDLGEDAGIKAGDILQVYREGSKIASVEVTKVRKSVSACDIRKEAAPIKNGDLVK